MGYKEMNGNKTGNGFDKNPQNINRKGRPVSLKKRFRELHGDFDGTIWIDKEQTTERTTEDGKVQIGLKLNSMDNIIFKLNELISSGKDNVSLNAIKFLWEQLDGKAKQTVENKNKFIDGIDFEFIDADDDFEFKPFTKDKIIKIGFD